MAKLTDGKRGLIAKADVPEKGQRFIFDDHRDSPRGFGLRVTAAGGKAFVLKYTIEGRERLLTIGAWPTWSLEAARMQAKGIRQQVDSGVDPLEKKRQRRQEPSVADLAKRFCIEHGDTMRSSAEIRSYLFKGLVPEFGRVKAKDLSRRDVRALIDEKRLKTPTAARILLAYTRSMFNWALERDIVETNPCLGIKVPASRKRTRVLDEEEIRAFWKGLPSAELLPSMRLVLRLILVTGQRPGEVAGMRWADIQNHVWIIPEHRHKTGDGQRVPLTPLAESLLAEAKAEQERLAKRRCGRPGHVFTKGKSPYTAQAVSRAANRNMRVLGNKAIEPWGHWTPHDLRRTVRTGLAALKIPEHIAERCIGHRPHGVIAIYDQHRYDPEKRAALEAWERRLRGILDGSPEGNVVPLRRAE